MMDGNTQTHKEITSHEYFYDSHFKLGVTRYLFGDIIDNISNSPIFVIEGYLQPLTFFLTIFDNF